MTVPIFYRTLLTHSAMLPACARTLMFGVSLQSNADASLLSGAINPTTIRQGIFGFNGGRNLLQSVKVCTNPFRRSKKYNSLQLCS